MKNPLETIIVNPASAASSCIIWLHGLGADGHDFEGIVPELQLPASHDIRFIFPHAPIRPITINHHIPMRGWYDIYSLDNLENEDEKGIATSREQVEQLIQTQIDQGIPSNKILLAGFSQGGAIALYLGLTYQKPIAGIIGLSTYLPFVRHAKQTLSITQHKTPILMCHGEYDDVIPAYLGKESVDYIQSQGLSVAWETYPMGHQVCSEEIRLIGNWIKQKLS